MEKMVIRRQSLEEMKEIYDGMLSGHFPADEIKPFWKIKDSYEKGEYMGYGLYRHAEDRECLAYAWMCSIRDENWILLDYYAVTEKLRGRGMGSRFLKHLFEECTEGIPVIIEVEDPDRLENIPEDRREEERERRLRRISFYLRNGVQETQLRARVFQVPYSIMIYKQDAQDRVSIDQESLKRAYYYFYSHVQGNVAIGDVHEIEHYTGRILPVGISYDKKTKEHRCVIEKYEKN